MSFRVAARTLLNLGAELISSDGVAFYELIKNGLDAGSRTVRVDVVVALPPPTYRDVRNRLVNLGHEQGGDDGPPHDVSLEPVRKQACEGIDPTAATALEAVRRLSIATTWEQLSHTLENVYSDLNYISVSDTGSGMSLEDLSDTYLTIGTPARFREREQWKLKSRDHGISSERTRPVLGEKGVGRLSAMRLGSSLHVQTSRAGETHWNILDINWADFSEDVDALIGDIPVQPVVGARKGDPNQSGTTIFISRLSEPWSREKVVEVANQEFSKLVDPFTSGIRLPARIYFNEQQIEIPRFNRILFEHAHATVSATYIADPEPRLSGRIWYVGNRRNAGDERETTFVLEGAHAVSAVGGMLRQEDITMDTLRSVGPFSLILYWYNRQRLSAIEGIGNLRAVRELLRRWAGGVMVFRDGFRVSPYGNLDDDWLDLDRRALGYRSFKVNRSQIVGKLDISSVDNLHLADQTNREGLRDTVEKRVLVRLLKWVIEIAFLDFLNAVDEEKPAKDDLDLDDLEARTMDYDSELDQVLMRLSREHPDVEQEYHIMALIQDNRQVLRTTMAEVRRRREAYETGRSQLVHLAGVGLMVEILAHELNRATTYTLNTLSDAQREPVPAQIATVLSTLEAQLRSLQKRLRTLDPLTTRGRQVKESFDLIAWVQDTLDAHRAQFTRHAIRLTFRTKPDQGARFAVRAVKGMIVQVLENLISNSVYWLDQERKLTPSFEPDITVEIDTVQKELRFSDNGPGIEPGRKEQVFQAFHSTKPPGAGNGLGLFIAREIAEYHDAALYLDTTPSGPHQTLHTLVFDLRSSQGTVSKDEV